MTRSRLLATATTALLAAVGLALGAPGTASADDAPGTSSERFHAGEPYTGMFADPSVLRTQGRYYGVATNHDGLNLPLMTSEDLATWTPRAPLADAEAWTGWSGYNDAMPTRPAWAVQAQADRANRFSQWAPSLARVGDTYVAAYSAARTLDDLRRSCIGLATSETPEGPYAPVSDEPTVCFEGSPRGVIDPDVHVLRDGRAFLLWKQEGIVDVQEPALMVQRLSRDGTRLKTGSQPRRLLELVRGTWKGGVIENPSMVRHHGRTYLFYSAHDWHSGDYAIGYATCRGPLGPCVDRTHDAPLIASDETVAGPGGADAFTDLDGGLRLAYAGWQPGRVGPYGDHARTLRIATLASIGRGSDLLVFDRG